MSDASAPPSDPRPDAVCDGGDLDCGSGLLLIVARALAPLPPGATLELRSKEPTVLEDLPAWCESQGHELVDVKMTSGPTCYLLRRGEDGVAAEGDVRAIPVVVSRRGDAWSHEPADETTARPTDHFLTGLAACLSDAVRRSGPGRAHAIEDVEVTLAAGRPAADAPLAVEGVVRVATELTGEEVRTLAREAVLLSPLARTLAAAPQLTIEATPTA